MIEQYDLANAIINFDDEAITKLLNDSVKVTKYEIWCACIRGSKKDARIIKILLEKGGDVMSALELMNMLIESNLI